MNSSTNYTGTALGDWTSISDLSRSTNVTVEYRNVNTHSYTASESSSIMDLTTTGLTSNDFTSPWLLNTASVNDSCCAGYTANWSGTGDDLWDTSRILYPREITSPPVWEVAVKVAAYAQVIVLALIGNLMVVCVVWKDKRLRTTTNCYLVNLAVSDLMVTCSCTWVHLVQNLTEGWVLGAFFCKINSFAQVLSLVSSILTLTLIACDRFFGIVFAMKAQVTERRSALFLLLSWLCAVAISSPLLMYREQHVRQWADHLEVWCADNWPYRLAKDPHTGVETAWHPVRTGYYTAVSVVLYFLPILVMTIAYSLIIWRLWSSRIPGERIQSELKAQNKMKKKVVIMLITILCVFALCWLPFQIVIFYSEYRGTTYGEFPSWYEGFKFFANYIAFANSAFNPLIYAGFNSNFRRAFKSLLRCRLGTPRPRYYYAVAEHLRIEESYESRSTTLVTKI